MLSLLPVSQYTIQSIQYTVHSSFHTILRLSKSTNIVSRKTLIGISYFCKIAMQCKTDSSVKVNKNVKVCVGMNHFDIVKFQAVLRWKHTVRKRDHIVTVQTIFFTSFPDIRLHSYCTIYICTTSLSTLV